MTENKQPTREQIEKANPIMSKSVQRRLEAQAKDRQPTQQELERFWKAWGFHLETDNRKNYHWEKEQRCHDWLTPDGEISGGSHGINKGKLPSLDSLEALGLLFKWIVPQLFPKYALELITWHPGKYKAIINKAYKGWAQTFTEYIDADPALALYYACDKVREEMEHAK